MKEILLLIEQKKQEFAQLPLFEFMRDKSIDPRQRLSFAPCMSPFVMSFGELNKYFFREEPTTDPIQAIINKHTYEDDHHWIWLLEDFQKLGLDRSMRFTDALRFLWSEETNISRRVAYELYRYTFQSSPIQKLVVIEAAETTGNVFLSVSSQVVLELKSTTNQEYRYFGGGHLVVDTGHTYCSPKAKRFIESIQLTKEDRTQYFQLVEKVFEVFTEFTNELLAYAKIHSTPQSFVTTSQLTSNAKPLGTYLVEAGLLKPNQLQIALDKQKETPMRFGEVVSSLGWVRQETIEYMMDKVVIPQRKSLASQTPQPMDLCKEFN